MICQSAKINNKYIQYETKGDKILTSEEYLSMIESYLVDMINDHKNQGEWKIQLSAEINFISSKPDFDETRIMHTKSNKIELRLVVTQMKLLRTFLDLFCKDIRKI